MSFYCLKLTFVMLTCLKLTFVMLTKWLCIIEVLHIQGHVMSYAIYISTAGLPWGFHQLDPTWQGSQTFSRFPCSLLVAICSSSSLPSWMPTKGRQLLIIISDIIWAQDFQISLPLIVDWKVLPLFTHVDYFSSCNFEAINEKLVCNNPLYCVTIHWMMDEIKMFSWDCEYGASWSLCDTFILQPVAITI